MEEIKTINEVYKNELLKAQLEIQEQTFNNISQEIHDNVGQILSLAKVQINIMNESETMSREMLNEVKENVGKAMTDLRDIAKSLSSERIRSLSVHNAVSNEAERINKSGISQVTIAIEGEEKKMNEQKKLILFRIIQESLQNSIKHANASRIEIQFHYNTGSLQVIIKDNGKGFDTEEAIKNNSGLGLLNIKTRAALTGGSSTIDSILNEGTTVNITIPYE
jgi:signal transduction histidine kinase